MVATGAERNVSVGIRGCCGVDGWSEADGVDEGCWGVWSATSTCYSSLRARNTRSLERMEDVWFIRQSGANWLIFK